MVRARRTHLLLNGSIALVIAAILLLVFASPLALPLVDRAGERDWRRLSEIGQTYGAVSALLSALALGGVIASLALQRHSAELDRRSAELDREQLLRSMHLELIKLGLNDPELIEIFPPLGSADTMRERRQYIYVNLWIMYYRMTYELGVRTGDELNYSIDRLFSGTIGRRWWSEIGPLLPPETVKGREFHRIMDERWRIAMERELRADPETVDDHVPDTAVHDVSEPPSGDPADRSDAP